jgi:uncharacterized protein
VIIADTSGLLAAFGKDARDHSAARTAIELDEGPVVISPFVLAELDYLLAERVGVEPELQFLREVAGGVFELATFGRPELTQATTVLERYRDMRIGLADASIVVLAARYGTTRLLTLDERHFRAIQPLRGHSFVLLPADQ